MINLGMVAECYKAGIIQLVNSPNGDGIVCKIGANWFYFGGESAESCDSVDEYKKNIPEDSIVKDIFDVLEDFRNTGDIFGDEYMYYECYLRKSLSREDTPIYRYSAEYARKHGELLQYRESHQANVACKEAIEKAITDNYRGNILDAQAILDTVGAKFSLKRIQYVLANTVQMKSWDGRFSYTNRKWAVSVSVTPDPDPWGNDRNRYFVVNKVHTGLTDLFINHFREKMN